MCILEATTLKRPWFPFGHFVFREKVRLGQLPDRPESFNDDQWDLLTKMCALKPADRVSIAYVVHQLKKFHENSNDAHDTHIEVSDSSYSERQLSYFSLTLHFFLP
uniref:Serine-threonine/tyrosine-protein kinase catalytic domain-containing protein n=1 Tax=Globisporangium ultimum (strain ATCC 200006 / CBS 805.95 / DAOM BR144) TaxID=431595 RepID=K3XDG3_GLOUD